MEGMPDLIELSKVLGESSRIQILDILMDKRFYTVNELAKSAKITASTASYHLKILTNLGWLETYRRGRFSYYALANETVAEVLEKLMLLASPKKVSSYKQKTEIEAVKKARTCYHHVAGQLGVQLLAFYLRQDYFIQENQQLELTNKGSDYFTSLGLEVPLIQKEAGSFTKLCLDWSERRFHLAGNLGKALYALFVQKGWLIHSTTNRSLQITASGKEYFSQFYQEIPL